MRYVLDTNVVSALRVRGRHPSVASWAASVPADALFITALTLAELERGVIAKERADPRQGAVLRRWFDAAVVPTFTNRVLPFDAAAARALATFRVPERAPLDDAIIAAIAISTGMTVVSRNARHFDPLGVAVLDPWRPAAD